MVPRLPGGHGEQHSSQGGTHFQERIGTVCWYLEQLGVVGGFWLTDFLTSFVVVGGRRGSLRGGQAH